MNPTFEYETDETWSGVAICRVGPQVSALACLNHTTASLQCPQKRLCNFSVSFPRLDVKNAFTSVSNKWSERAPPVCRERERACSGLLGIVVDASMTPITITLIISNQFFNY